LNGQITSDGGGTITERRFSWGSTSSCADGYTAAVTVNGNSFSYTFTGLTSGQKYYFQAWAKNSAGWGNGSALSFTTTIATPTLSVTNPAGGATWQVGASQTISWSVSGNTSSIYGYLVYLSTNNGGSYLSIASTIGASSQSVSYTPNSSQVTSSAVLWVKAIDNNANIIGSGFTNGTFIIANSALTAPTVSTVVASAVGSAAATLNAQISSTGGATITERRFSWGSTSSCSDGWTPAVTVNGNSFSYTLTSLTPGQKYYFQAWAKNSVGWAIGSTLSFTTTSIPATTTPGTPEQHQIDATIPYEPPIAATGDVAVHGNHLRIWDSSLVKWLAPIDADYQTKLNAFRGSGKPVVVIAHGWHDGIDQNSWTSNIAVLLHAQNGSAVILAWNWRSDANPSGTYDPRVDIGKSGLMMAAASATSGNLTGKLLAMDLVALQIDPDQTQLIGHSNGAAVMGSAAHVLAQQHSMRVKRLTTLDAPDLCLGEIPIDWLAQWVPNLEWNLLTTLFTTAWQWSTSVHVNQLYIDNRDVQQVDAYFSNGLFSGRKAFGFGSPLANHGVDNVFNGKLTTAGTFLVAYWYDTDHFRTHEWYTAHNDPSNPNVAGASWSILNPTNGWHSGNYDETGYGTGVFPSGPVIASSVTRLTNETGYDTGTLSNSTAVASPVLVYRPITHLTFDQAETWQGQHTTITDTGLETHGFVSRIQTEPDGHLFKDINIPTNAEYLTFDYLVEGPGAYLTLQFGDNVIYYHDLTGPTGWITTEHLYVGLWAGQTNTLLFTLHQVGSAASLLVDNITFSTTISPPLRPMAVDLNRDGIPNFQDFSYFAMFWLNTSCSSSGWCDGRDFDHDGIVGVNDLQIFAEFWLWPVADINVDGVVNMPDFADLTTKWNDQNCTSPEWCSYCDVNKSGSVDLFDLEILAEYWLWDIRKADSDLNADGKVNMSDFNLFSPEWLQTNCVEPTWCNGADLNKDTQVDILDLAEFAAYWLEGT
jgi:hypothetical protein